MPRAIEKGVHQLFSISLKTADLGPEGNADLFKGSTPRQAHIQMHILNVSHVVDALEGAHL